jgi:hypothetical protein
MTSYALKDAATAMRTPLLLDPDDDAARDACRRVLVAHGATDLLDMVCGDVA